MKTNMSSTEREAILFSQDFRGDASPQTSPVKAKVNPKSVINNFLTKASFLLLTTHPL